MDWFKDHLCSVLVEEKYPQRQQYVVYSGVHGIL
jgi:hypothetical protein